MYAPISMILSVGLLASNVAAAPDTKGKCRVHIRQSATNWIDWVEIFDPSGTSIGNSWDDPRYNSKSGARASDKMDIGMTGKEWRLVITGHDEETGRYYSLWDLDLEYSGHKYESKKNSHCSVGGWDNTKGAPAGNLKHTANSLFESIHRDMDCYFEC
ncbi:hypothetical protein ACKAV7_014587 [Fusarium commune]